MLRVGAVARTLNKVLRVDAIARECALLRLDAFSREHTDLAARRAARPARVRVIQHDDAIAAPEADLLRPRRVEVLACNRDLGVIKRQFESGLAEGLTTARTATVGRDDREDDASTPGDAEGSMPGDAVNGESARGPRSTASGVGRRRSTRSRSRWLRGGVPGRPEVVPRSRSPRRADAARSRQ